MVTIVYYEEDKAKQALACFNTKLKIISKEEFLKITADYKTNQELRVVTLIGYNINMSPELIEKCKYAFTECFKEFGMSVIR